MHNNKRFGCVVVIVFAVFLGFCSFSYGYVEPVRKVLPNITETTLTNPDLTKRKGLDISNIVLHSALSTGFTIDPNIYLANQDEKYDIIYTEKASFGVEIPIKKKYTLSMDYEATEYHYERFYVNDHVDQRARGLINIDLTDYRLTLRDTFRNFTDLPGSTNTSRLKQDTNDMRLGLTRESGKFGFDFGYTNAIHHYYSTDIIAAPVTYKDRSSMRHVLDASVGCRLWPKTSVILENDFGVSDHESPNSPDYYFNDILLGIKGELWKKLSGSFLAGFRNQNFETSAVMFDKTFSGVVMRSSLRYAVSDKDLLNATITRSIEDSTYQSLTYYAANFFGLNFTHVFTNKITGQAFGTYQRNGYPTETTEGAKTAKRMDNAYGAGFSLKYDIHSWLSAELGYEFKKARSNFRTFDYEDNIATFKVTAGF